MQYTETGTDVIIVPGCLVNVLLTLSGYTSCHGDLATEEELEEGLVPGFAEVDAVRTWQGVSACEQSSLSMGHRQQCAG